MKRGKSGSITVWLTIGTMGLALLLPLAWPGRASASAPVKEYAIPTAGSAPYQIASAGGDLWFAESNVNQIGKITTSGSVQEYPILTAHSGPTGITASPDGNLWFTEYSVNQIARITVSGAVTEWAIPTANSQPWGIAAGADGAIWFTEQHGNRIGKLTTSVTEYSIPTTNSQPYSIAAGADGNLWFTEYNANQIGRITTSGTFAEYTIPTPNSGPLGITAGPDGNLWFTEYGAGQIGKITTSGTVTEYPVPASGPHQITSGSDGNLWFAEYGGNQIGRLTPQGSYAIYSIPTPNNHPLGIAAGPDSNIWFTEYGVNQIGKVQLFSPTFYFAEGTCRPNFDTYFCIQNTGGLPAEVALTYMKGDGTNAYDHVTVPTHSRATVSPRSILGTGDDTAHDFSTQVTCTNGQTIIAERPMYFNYKGVWTGGHDVMGAAAPAASFYFAEGTCRPNFDTYFCIQNPGGIAADVGLTYMKGDGTIAMDGLTVPAHSRMTVLPRNTLGTGDDAAHDFSTQITCTNGQSIVCERPMYFDYAGAWTGGSCVMGATYASPTFYFAEGTCRPGFDSYFCIENPWGFDDPVILTYMKGDGTTATDNVTVPAHSRATVFPRYTLGTGNDIAHDFSTTVVSNGLSSPPIVVERPMYFDYAGAWTGGHDVVGATTLATTFYFAEGTCRPGFDPYFCILNSGSSPATVVLIYMAGDGTIATDNETVAAHSRMTVLPRNTLGTGDDAAHDFSAMVNCTNGQPILVERPMYFDYHGIWTGGHDVVGFAPE